MTLKRCPKVGLHQTTQFHISRGPYNLPGRRKFSIYRSPRKLLEGNVFSRVCHFVQGGLCVGL